HTRFSRDWSSDVCSDLHRAASRPDLHRRRNQRVRVAEGRGRQAEQGSAGAGGRSRAGRDALRGDVSGQGTRARPGEQYLLMPQILPRYAPADQKWWRETEEAGNKERDERRKRIETLWRYYEGEQKKPLKVKPGRPDLNVILNLSGEAINKMVAFVGQPRFELAGGTDRKPNAFGML